LSFAKQEFTITNEMPYPPKVLYGRLNGTRILVHEFAQSAKSHIWKRCKSLDGHGFAEIPHFGIANAIRNASANPHRLWKFRLIPRDPASHLFQETCIGMLKKGLFIFALAMLLPLAAMADSNLDFSNVGGTLSGSSSGLTLSGSTLVSVDGLVGGGLVVGSNLGSVTFSTGSLLSGTLQTGATFDAGGSFVITGNGTNGLANGVIFTGTFSQPVTWSVVTVIPGQLFSYTLVGTVTGTLSDGTVVNGVTMQLAAITTKLFNGNPVNISSGDTAAVAVPEYGSMSMMFASFATLAGGVFWKVKNGVVSLR
jgi:hypothetical protein